MTQKGALSEQEPHAKIREELAAMSTIVDALEPIPTRAKRLRILAAVAVIMGHDEAANHALAAAHAEERAERER